MQRMFVLLAVFAFLINIPFGRLRSKVKKFSWRWFAYIHIPIPFIALPRILLGISYYFIPLFLSGIRGRSNYRIKAEIWRSKGLISDNYY